jgi:hypothetical protein
LSAYGELTSKEGKIHAIYTVISKTLIISDSKEKSAL